MNITKRHTKTTKQRQYRKDIGMQKTGLEPVFLGNEPNRFTIYRISAFFSRILSLRIAFISFLRI